MRASRSTAAAQIRRGLVDHHPRGRTLGQIHGFDAANSTAATVREILGELLAEGKVRVATRPHPTQSHRPPIVEYFWIPDAPAPSPSPGRGRAGGAVRMSMIRCAHAARKGGIR